jgi:hypothetical protein
VEFLNDLHAICGGRVIFSLGNHDILFARELKESNITSILNSNLTFNTSHEYGRLLNRQIKRYIIEDRTLFLGFCTLDVFKKSSYRVTTSVAGVESNSTFTTRHALFLPGNPHRDARNFWQVVREASIKQLTATIQAASMFGDEFDQVVLLAHAGIDETRTTLDRLNDCGVLAGLTGKKKFVAIGHWHDSQLAYNRGQMIDGFQVIAPRAFGKDVGVVGDQDTVMYR